MPIKQVDLEDMGEDKQDEDKPASRRERQERTREEGTLSARLRACFDRIAEALDQRGDEELADIVREDAAVMAAGLMSLTRPFKPVRSVVVLFVSVIEPLLAFGRILRVMLQRWAERRAAEQAAREAEADATPQPFPPA